MIETSASELKAKLGAFLRAVREGKEVLVKDRGKPVARVVPYAPAQGEPSIAVSQPRDPAAPPLREVRIRGIPPRGIDTAALLREDRDRR